MAHGEQGAWDYEVGEINNYGKVILRKDHCTACIFCKDYFKYRNRCSKTNREGYSHRGMTCLHFREA